jgi:hypothetical protein
VTYLAMLLSILADDPLTAAFCLSMAGLGSFLLIAGFWPGS